MCKAPKFFNFESDPGVIVQDKKVTEEKARFIIIQKRNGASTKEIARDLKVSQRRVQQVIRAYREAGQETLHRRQIGRPNKPYDEKEAEIVKSAYERYRLGARMLENVIRKQYNVRISHNRIHMYLKAQGLARANPNKQKCRKWFRYERKDSMSAGHIDWHQWNRTDINVCVILDDASRMILAGGEFSKINIENSKKVIDQMVDKFWWLCPMGELIMNQRSEFGADRIHDDGCWSSDFKDHIEKYGIKPILARRKHALANGKIERFFGEYEKHRYAFPSFEDFAIWYNDRPHGSLNLERLETPEIAFWRKMPSEAYFAIAYRLFGL